MITSQSEVASFIRILQEEAAYALKYDSDYGTVATRFLVPWSFDLGSVSDLLESQCPKPVVSDDVIFECNYGIAFSLGLTVSRASLDSPGLKVHLNPIKMIGNYLSRIDINACGSVIAPDPKRSIITLTPVVGGANLTLPDNVTNRKMPHDEFDDSESQSSDIQCCSECTPFSELVSIVRVDVSRWALGSSPCLCVGPNANANRCSTINS